MLYVVAKTTHLRWVTVAILAVVPLFPLAAFCVIERFHLNDGREMGMAAGFAVLYCLLAVGYLAGSILLALREKVNFLRFLVFNISLIIVVLLVTALTLLHH